MVGDNSREVTLRKVFSRCFHIKPPMPLNWLGISNQLSPLLMYMRAMNGFKSSLLLTRKRFKSLLFLSGIHQENGKFDKESPIVSFPSGGGSNKSKRNLGSSDRARKMKAMKLISDKRTHCVTGVQDISVVEEIVGSSLPPLSRRGTVRWETAEPYPQETVDAIKARFWRNKCAMNVQNDWIFNGDSYTDLA